MPDTGSVATRLLEAMAAAGATTVYGLPGVHNLAFWHVRPDRAAGDDGHRQGLARAGPLPRLVNVRHEQTAVYAADGFARLGTTRFRPGHDGPRGGQRRRRLR